MEKWIPVVLIITLLAGSGGSYLVTSNIYKPQVASLESQLVSTQQALNEKTQNYTVLLNNYQTLLQAKATLDTNFASLTSTYNELKNKHETLQYDYNSLKAEQDSLNADYNALSSQYDTLKASIDSGFIKLSSDYVDLQKKYDILSQTVASNVYNTPGDSTMLKYFYQLTKDVRTLNATLWSYFCEESSFKNTITVSEIIKVESTVRTIIGSSTNEWNNYQHIHEYITSNIKYVYDITFPYITYYSYIDVNGIRYLTGFDTSNIDNYIQKPQFTLQYKQGDCDDQAALEYAMLRYYNKYIVGTDYNLYLAVLQFSDGSGHVAVFMPIQGGKVTIFDPAGNYLTTSGYSLSSKSAASELESYNSHWISSSGSITNIDLYWINITDGSSTLIAHGTRAEIATYLAK
jgi:hypothetical protein